MQLNGIFGFIDFLLQIYIIDYQNHRRSVSFLPPDK